MYYSFGSWEDPIVNPHFSPGGVVMAQEFFPQRVLATEGRSGHYVRGSMCALRGKGQARARPAQSVLASPLNKANQGTEEKLFFVMYPATRREVRVKVENTKSGRYRTAHENGPVICFDRCSGRIDGVQGAMSLWNERRELFSCK